jgi:competence protein ComEA
VPFVSLSRRAAVALSAVLLVLLVLVGHRLARTGTARAPAVAAPIGPVKGAAPTARKLLVVHVVGAVRRAGLYRLPDGARVADAVARAGGAARMADLSAINLAAPLVDGVQVLVPRRVAEGVGAGASSTGRLGAAGSSGAAAGGLGRKLSLSAATVEELDQLPGVGPATAQKIVDYRAAHGAFRSVDDLDAVPGIGPARIEQLRDLVTP